MSIASTFASDTPRTQEAALAALGSLGPVARSLENRSQDRTDRSERRPGSGAAEPAFKLSLSEAGKARAQNEAPAADQSDTALSESETQEVEKLKQRDREVRAHEAAHAAAAGGLANGGASFQYTTGPDGKRYATSGEVSIDTSAVKGDPEATAAKMQRVRAAALAPANPSGQDRRVAAEASAKAQAARAEAAQPDSSEEKSHSVGGHPGHEDESPHTASPDRPRIDIRA